MMVPNSAAASPSIVAASTVARAKGGIASVRPRWVPDGRRKRHWTRAAALPGLARATLVWKNVLVTPSAKYRW
jgi:hypothetical protein